MEIERAVAIDRQTIGDHHPDHGDTLRGMADLLCAERRCGEAVTPYRQAVALHEQEVGPDSAVLVEPLTGLCNALLASGDPRAARSVAERAVALVARVPADLRGAAEFCLARCEWAAGERSAAAQRARAARAELAALPYPARVLPALDRWLADRR
jgi:hypothetical protein